jgi:3-dehydrosphinganine reductase
MQLQGASALITGGSSGIGLAIAARMVRRGAHVYLVARTHAALETAAKDLACLPGAKAQQISTIACDVADADSVQEMFRRLRDAAVALDIVVNSAGVSLPGRFSEQPLADIERLMRVNYFGTVHVLRQAVPEMIARRRGHILNLGSVASLLGVYGLSGYCGSKFAVRGLTESLRYELKPLGVTVCLLCPPDTDTPMLAAEAAMKPAETAALSKSAGVMTADAVADAALKGMAKGTAVIVPGLEAGFTVLAQRLAPSLVERISDRIIRSAQR